MKKTILITGSGGFVGRNIKEYFKDGEYKILAPRSFELDCTDKNAVREYFSKNSIDYIIHCASTGGMRGVEDKHNTLEYNLSMFENLLEVKSTETRMIIFGSGAMYGKQRALHKIAEDKIGEVIPQDLYGESKMLIAQKIQGRKDVICLNIFACYGKGELETRFPTYAITQNINHLPIEINRNVIFDYLYIDDLCRITEHFIKHEQKKYNIINVTPDESIELLQIAKIVNKIGGYNSKIIVKSDSLGNEYTGDNSRLHNEIPNFKFTPYEKGLSNLYQHIDRSSVIL